jgi:octaheme c-type cytochrome (tetrathionate reductase family)
MRRIFLAVIVFALGVALSVAFLTPNRATTPPLEVLKARYARTTTPSADHGKFTQLRKHFSTPQEVTAACIECHNGRHTEVMQSTHWNWEREEYIPGKGIRSVGKRNLVNNFCIGVAGSRQSCNKCHAGYGWNDDQPFNFTDANNVDCLACHDQSGDYVKASGGAGYPAGTVDLGAVARTVGKPQRLNCGTCHFFSGGGNNVKHGDLESALFAPDRSLDVHMAVEGVDMSCTACHTAEKHQMKGKLYSISSMNRNRVLCEDCHGATPHTKEILNEHTLKVACQTCHIPTYAKANATKTWWDWSQAGRTRNGAPFEEKDSLGNVVYLSEKGRFIWQRDLRPEYVWFNGTASHYLLGDTAGAAPVRLNRLFGSYADPDAKIVPAKIHRGTQPYDPGTGMLIQPLLAGDGDDRAGFWDHFDMVRASRDGMALVGLPFSGHTEYIATEMTWPVNHMVAPAAQAVTCTECHTRSGSRLTHLRDFYMPGRDSHPLLETGGTVLLLLTVAGAGVHAAGRIITGRKGRTT